MSKSNTPQKVRLSISSGPAAQLLTPQGRLKTKGFLMPPPGPSEPGGFDFRRYAWFRGLGAVGYTREGVHITSGPSSGILRGFLTEEWRFLRGLKPLSPRQHLAQLRQ
jgi:competence protein ComEC